MPTRSLFTVALFFAAVIPACAQGQGEELKRAPDPRASREELAKYFKAERAAMAAIPKVTYTCDDLPLVDALAKMKETCQFPVGVTGRAVTAAESIHISLNFNDTDGAEVVSFLVEVTQFTMILGADGRLVFVDMREPGVAMTPGAKEALEMRRAEDRDSSDHSLPDFAPMDPKRIAALAEKKVTVQAKDATLPGVLEDLTKQTGIKIQTDYWDPKHAELDSRKVTFNAEGKPLTEALDAMCAASGLEWHPRWTDIYVSFPGRRAALRAEYEAELKAAEGRKKEMSDLFAREVNIHGDKLSARDLAEALEKSLGVPCYLDADAWDSAKTWELPDMPRPASEIRDLIQDEEGFSVFYGGGVLWITCWTQ